MKKTTMLALVAALAAPAALAAQATVRAEASVSAGAETQGRGEREQARGGASADAEVQLAVRAGLPGAPVQRAADRAHARGASQAEAARAAAQVRARLQTSHDAIVASGRAASEAEVIAGADALARGAAQTDLEVIADSAPRGRRLTASFQALTRLGAQSGSFSQAAGAIATRLQSGTSDRAITRLAASGSVDAMLRGTTGGLNVGTRAAGGVSGTVGGVLGGGAGVTGGVTGAVGGIVP